MAELTISGQTFALLQTVTPRFNNSVNNEDGTFTIMVPNLYAQQLSAKGQSVDSAMQTEVQAAMIQQAARSLAARTQIDA